MVDGAEVAGLQHVAATAVGTEVFGTARQMMLGVIGWLVVSPSQIQKRQGKAVRVVELVVWALGLVCRARTSYTLRLRELVPQLQRRLRAEDTGTVQIAGSPGQRREILVRLEIS